MRLFGILATWTVFLALAAAGTALLPLALATVVVFLVLGVAKR